MNKILETTEETEKALHSFCEGEENIRNRKEKVFNKEKETDEIKSEIYTIQNSPGTLTTGLQNPDRNFFGMKPVYTFIWKTCRGRPPRMKWRG